MTIEPSAQNRIGEVVQAILQAAGAPGGSVAVVRGGEEFVSGYGVKTLGSPAPVDADTLFVCASTTKAFTTTLLALLADEKELAWDAPVRRYLPDFRLSDPHADALLTVRDLVTHRTGLPRHDALWYHSALTTDEVLRRAAFLPFTHPFRQTYQYQNLCYMAASRVAVKAAGAPDFETLLRERILHPLGMMRSPLTWGGMEADPNRAEGHQRVKGQVQRTPRICFDSIEGAGALHTSAAQMLGWLRFHLSGGLAPDGTRLLSDAALQETYRTQIAQPHDPELLARYPTVTTHAYGLGWSVWQYPLWGVRGSRASVGVLSHGGYLDGFRAHVFLAPSEKIGLAVFANLSAPLIESLRSALFDILLDLDPTACPDWPALVKEDVEKAEAERVKKENEKAEMRTTALPSPVALDAYAGHYTHLAYGEATVAIDGDTLSLTWNDHTSALAHDSFTSFTCTTDAQPLQDETVRFTLTAEGTVNGVVLWDTTLARQ